jgi:hypothetical protein
MKTKHSRSALGVAIALLALAGAPLSAQQSNPYAALVPAITSKLPADPVPPENLSVPDQQPFFDAYAWQVFIALSWPADIVAGRGQPAEPDQAGAFLAANRTARPSVPVVWSTYRTAEELFLPGGAVPPQWSAGGRKPHFSMFQKSPSTNTLLKEDFDQAFGGPLIDQHGNYTMYQVFLNQLYYDTVANNQWYLRDKLTQAIGRKGIAMPWGAIELKASWRPIVKSDDASRYFITEGSVLQPDGGHKIQRMGLVGLHIAVKTPTRPQWLWATFEQVDNVSAKYPLKASYNSGGVINPKGYSGSVPSSEPPFPLKPAPVEVNRVTPILTTPAGYSTSDLNAAYQKLLAGTVWANYELIVNQWPTSPQSPSRFRPKFDPRNYKPEMAGDPFPRFVANTTMETYFQGNDPEVKKAGNTSNSCLQCHFHAQANGCDFSWALYNRAYAPPTPTKAASKAPVTPK